MNDDTAYMPSYLGRWDDRAHYNDGGVSLTVSRLADEPSP